MKFRDAPRQLVEKYGSLFAKDYIEYCGKEFWSTDFSESHYRDALAKLLKSGEPIVLYLHIPYCAQMCYFCLCHFKISHDYGVIRDYLDVLLQEISLLQDCVEGALVNSRGRSSYPLANIREMHLGGGSPTILREADFKELRDWLEQFIDFKKLDEFTIEIDPRRVGTDRMHFYADMGIDRISFGVQDFDRGVQERINRVQPYELLENLLRTDIRKRFKSVNFDMLIGLPGQTAKTVENTFDRVKTLRPDRVALSYMHFNPKVHKHQAVMRNDGPLPSAYERKEMHALAVEMLEAAGYVRSGYEHFALPTDEVAKAVEAGKVQYNSLGATPGRCSYLIGLGESAYSRVGPYHYSQSFYERDKWEGAINEGRFPVWRGHHLTPQDVLRREIIQTLRSLFRLDIDALNDKYKVHLGRMMMREFAVLGELRRDGLVEFDDHGLEITDFGRNFTNLICRVFDRYAMPEPSVENFFGGPKVEL